MINSVCGCATGSARPGISLALQNNIIPDKLFTVFAGQEREAVDRLRQYIPGFPPSSPCVALFKNGELIYFMQRYDIEGNNAKTEGIQTITPSKISKQKARKLVFFCFILIIFQ